MSLNIENEETHQLLGSWFNESAASQPECGSYGRYANAVPAC